MARQPTVRLWRCGAARWVIPEQNAPYADIVSANPRMRGAIGGAASGVRSAHARSGIGWQDGSCILIVRVNLCGHRKRIFRW
ncbi:hypothetical protein ACQEPB_03690 [Novosphingobium fluoreni]|uniref:hypothetical protein n=1 Tax=Novosphingobium fluoreni TaxID=1391222 RepID=UPI003D9FF707